MIKRDIIKLALDYIESNVNKDNWPEDDWASLNEHLDLNVYYLDDDKNNKHATVFPVVNGKTDITKYIDIF